MSHKISDLTEKARTGVRLVPWQTVLAGAAGASVLALLTVAGLGPLIAAVAAGTLSLSQVQSWLANLGANALSDWVASWATSAPTKALSDADRAADLEQRAADLEQRTAADPAITPALARLLAAIDAIPHSLDAIALELSAQSDVLLIQHQLLQRIAADVDHRRFEGSELRRLVSEVLPVVADRIIGTVTGHVDASAAAVLVELRALRDKQGSHVDVRAEGQGATAISAGAYAKVAVDNRTGVVIRGSQTGPITIGTIVMGDQVLQPTPSSPDLAAALTLLAQLPTDELPAPAMLPIGSRVPDRNPNFMGRRDDLRWLARALRGEPASRATSGAAITGLAGLGKTDLATEFAHCYGQFFAGGVFMLGAASRDVLAAEVAACGGTRHLGLYPADTDLGLEEQVDRVLVAWRGPLPRLLIFDSCEDEELLRLWRDHLSGSGCRMLVTSQRGSWSKSLGLAVRPLDVLARTESVNLLAAHRPDLAGHAALGQIADELGDLPLALHLTGSFLETYRDNPTLGDPGDFLAELRDQQLLGHDALQGIDVTPSPTNHDLHVARTFALCHGRLDASKPLDALALRLLDRASFLAMGEAIPWRLLLAMAGVSLGDQAGEREVERAILRLISLGLVTRAEAGGVRIHRLLAVFVRRSTAAPDAGAAAERAVLEASNALNQLTAPTLLPPIQPHLRHMVQAASARQDVTAARLFASLGEHLFLLGSTKEALVVYQNALTVTEALHGPTHSETLRLRDRIALLLKDLARFDEAYAVSTESLTRREGLPTAGAAEVAENHHLIGDVLVGRGNYAEARTHYERALELRTAVLGEAHHLTLTTLTSLSILLCQIDPPAAEALFTRARESERQLLVEPGGDMLTGVALVRAMFLALLRKDVTAGERLLERVRKLYQHMVSINHPDVPRELRRLFSASDRYGISDGDNLEEFLVRIFGEYHPRTVLGLMVLAAIHQRAGELADARRLYDRALAIQRQLRHGGRLETAQLIWWRGILFAQSGQRDAARGQLRRAVIIYTRVLSAGHPTTRRCAADLHRLDQQPRGKRYTLKIRRSQRRRTSKRRRT